MISIDTTHLRKGTVFKSNGRVYLVQTYKHIKKGRGLAVVRVKVRDVETDAVVEKTFSSNEKVEAAEINYKSVQFLYNDDNYCYFMDLNDFSQMQIEIEKIEEDLGFLVEGLKLRALILGDKVISIEVPKKVKIKVKQTGPGIMGDSAANKTKEAILETGLRLQVPLFIKEGDEIIVNTEGRNYVSKA